MHVLHVVHVPVCIQQIQHELSDRGTWYGTSAETEQFRLYILERIKLAKHAGMKVMEMLEEEYSTKRYYDKGCNLECTDSRYGTWMLNKQYASSCLQLHMKSDLILILHLQIQSAKEHLTYAI